MTSRERVLAALNHREPDRVPIDLSGHRSSGIAAMAYPKLREFLGLPPKPVRIYDPIQQLAIVHEDVLERFGVDTIELGRAFAAGNDDWADWVLPNGAPCQMPAWARPEREEGRWVMRSQSGRVIAQMPDGAYYFEQTHFPFAENDDLDRIEEAMDECVWCAVASPPGPLTAGPGGTDRLREGARRLRSETDRAIVALFGGNLLEMGQFLYRNDNFLMLFAADPKRAHAFLDKVLEMHLASLETFLGAVGDYVDVVLFGDDLGMQGGPQMSVEMYHEYLQPRQKQMWTRAKELADVKTNLHCCGGVRPLLPGLIDAGLDSINPVQISAEGMEAEALKRDFGQDITFWGGGCDTQQVLPHGSIEEVTNHVRHQVSTLKLGGGFVFQQVHNIMHNVPPANIMAMYDAALATGRYD
jgi:uroporphyrinogen decarboxylase